MVYRVVYVKDMYRIFLTYLTILQDKIILKRIQRYASPAFLDTLRVSAQYGYGDSNEDLVIY